ncbi:hypothetical protein [Klebsiella oxytoca]|uniref:hypothetical protein n=1 Tax=Klebsiella oxytoca TaxID=571 RepID=UPI0033132644
MTSNQLTRERLEKIKSWRETYGAGSNVMLPAEEAEALARMALDAMDSAPVAEIRAYYPLGIDGGKQKFVQVTGELPDFGAQLYAAPQPAAEMTATVERLNASGYEYEDGEVTPQNVAAVVDILLQQLDDAVQVRDAQPAPIVPEECPAEIHDLMASHSDALFNDDDAQEIWNACRAAILQAGNSPVIPDGYVMVPAKLTAENGAKSALLGEFNLEYTLTCHECFGEGCEDCNDEGRWINSIPVDWTTIKAIWSKAVEHFVATQQEEKSE